MVIIRAIAGAEFGKLVSFYRENGYRPSIRSSDRLLAAERHGMLCGALRICREEGVLVLRGMRVSKPFQRRGIGRRLLQRAEGEIGDEVCFCIPHRHLQAFYAQIGFEPIEPDEAPAFLRRRHESYRRDFQLDVMLMRRPAGARPSPQ